MTNQNHVEIVGNLTRDGEMKYTSGGLAILKLSIAVNRSIKKGDAWENEASFFDVTAFGKLAEWRAGLQKGDGVAVYGSLRQERWEKDGQTHSRVVIMADEILKLAPREKSESAKSGDGFPDDIPW